MDAQFKGLFSVRAWRISGIQASLISLTTSPAPPSLPLLKFLPPQGALTHRRSYSIIGMSDNRIVNHRLVNSRVGTNITRRNSVDPGGTGVAIHPGQRRRCHRDADRRIRSYVARALRETRTRERSRRIS